MKKYRNHHSRNAVKAALVTNYIKARKKQGYSHELAKAEAHEIYKIKSSKNPDFSGSFYAVETTDHSGLPVWELRYPALGGWTSHGYFLTKAGAAFCSHQI